MSPIYHSSFVTEDEGRSPSGAGGKNVPVSAGIAMLPFKKGHNSVPNLDDMAEDIIEEALNLFRLNAFAKSFDIKGPADRTLVYLFLVIGECLGRIRPEMGLTEAQKALAVSAMQPVVLPGEAAFPLNGMFPSARGGNETEQLRGYLSGLRGEVGARLLNRLYPSGTNTKGPNPWWMSYQRRKFMNKTL